MAYGGAPRALDVSQFEHVKDWQNTFQLVIATDEIRFDIAVLRKVAVVTNSPSVLGRLLSSTTLGLTGQPVMRQEVGESQ